VISNGGPIRDKANRITGAVVVYRDVTQAKETERQLRQAQKMEAVGSLTGGVAHDFNNILTVITGTIEILEEAVADKPGLAAIAKMIDEAASRGADLTQRLLAFARKQPLQPREIHLNDLVVETVKLLKPTLGEDIEVEALLKDGLPTALVDPSQLTTALLNLALNSRDAMPDGGRLLIETAHAELDEAYCRDNREAQPGQYVMLAVSDTGTGIPKALQEKVFEPFFTTKDVGRGTGLGLSMVYGFVKQSGGHVTIYSEPGAGTSVKMYFPRYHGDAASGTETQERLAPRGHSEEVILVVEDNAHVRAYSVSVLVELGYNVLEAEHPDAALSILRTSERIDLLFTTGYSRNAIVHHGRLDAGVQLISKPFTFEGLATRVRDMLDGIPSAAKDAAEKEL
jgi:nitrogen-specific signal transduction histidine kinase